MLGIKRNTIIISAISLALLAILVTVIWLFFPIILRTISPTWYAQYAFVRTINIVREEITEVNDFFDFPDFSNSDIMRLTIDSSDISANVSYGGFFSPSVNLSNLNIGIDLLHDRNTKQASLDLNTSWGDNSFLLTLYTNVTQVAFGINDRVSWAANADSIGKEFASLELPVDEDLKLDLGFLFPDIADDSKAEDFLIPVQDFFMSLRFRRSESADYFANDNGTVVTALICGNELESLVHDIYSLYGLSEANDELRDIIANISDSDHELTVLINEEHFVEAVHITVNVNTNSTVILTAQLLGTENMIDHILLDVRIEDEHSYQVYSLESKGQHVPVDSKLTNTTTIIGFDIGEIQICSEIREDRALSIAAQLGSTELDIEGVLHVGDDTIGLNLHNVNFELNWFGTFSMSGGFNISLGTTSQEIRDITSGAYNIADFETAEFYTLYQVMWDVIRQDQTLIEMFGRQLYDFVLTSLFGEQTASFLKEIFDDSVADVTARLNGLLAERVDNILDLLIIYLDGRTDAVIEYFIRFLDGRSLAGLENIIGSDLFDNLTGQLDGIREYLNRFFSR